MNLNHFIKKVIPIYYVDLLKIKRII